MDRAASLTANFYAWEMRGRGWMLWDSLVDLEPAFIPFFGHQPLFPVEEKDDGFSHSVLSWTGAKIAELFKETAPQEEDKPSFFEPAPYEAPDYFPFVEISVHLPSNWNARHDTMLQLLGYIASSNIPISFEIIGTGKDIRLHFMTSQYQAEGLYNQLYILFPKLVIQEAHPKLHHLFDPDNLAIHCIDYGLSQEFMRPLNTGNNSNLLINVIAALESLQEGELGVFQVMTQGTLNPWIPSILKSVSDGSGKSFLADAPEMVGLAKEKTRYPLCATVIRTLVQGKTELRAGLIHQNLVKAVMSGSHSSQNSLIPLSNEDYDGPTHVVNIIKRQSPRYGMLLNTHELAGLIQFPVVGRGKMAASQRTVVATPMTLQGNPTVLGKNTYIGKETQVSLSTQQRLRHTHIIGATGTGKSTLLINMMIQDITSGGGLTLLDPHGDVADTILAHIPENRVKDVILIDPSDAHYPVGINILSVQSEAEKIVLSADLTALFRRLSTSWGDQMDAILGNAVNVFLEHPEGGTLLDLRMFLTDRAFRKEILAKVDDAYVRHFWEKEFPMLRKNAAAPLLTRLDIFLRPKVIRRMMGQKKGLDFSHVINNNKILIIKLAQGLIGEANAYLLGTLITSKLYQAAQGRQQIAKEKRKPYFIYIDEFQNFITPSMEAILSGARKFGLGMVLAHQDLQQLFKVDARIGNSLISNAGTRVCFRIGELDAQKLYKGFHHFDVSDLQNLGVGEAIIRADRSDQDCSITTYLLPDAPDNADEIRKAIIQNTRTNYTSSDDVDAVFNRTTTAEPEKEKPTKKKEPPKPVEDTPVATPKPKPAEEYVPFVDVEIETEEPELSDIDKAAEEFKEQKRKRDMERIHSQLQEFIRKTAQDYQFKAILEEQTTNPAGRVDIGISTQKIRLACEISVTTPPAYEMKNIRKCLANGYDIVFMCSDNEKHLKKIQTLCENKLPLSQYPNVLFGNSKDMIQLLHDISLQEQPPQETVKGYRVKVNYHQASANDSTRQTKNIIQMILDAQKKRNKK